MVVVKTSQLTMNYGSRWGRRQTLGLNGLDLEVRENEIFGYLGTNGAGKTTTLKILTGLMSPTGGQAWIFGKEVTDVSVRREIGFLPENPYFYEYLTADESLDFYGKLHEMTARMRRSKADDLIESLDLADARNVPLREYSKGMRQRLGLAQALINDPKLLLLDEPMSGLDPLGRKQIRDVIMNLKEQGKTIFFSSHILSDVEMICDHVGIIKKGRLVADGKLSQLLSSRIKSVELLVSGLKQEHAEMLRAQGVDIHSSDDEFRIVAPDQDSANRTIQAVLECGGVIKSVVPNKESLEEYFLRKEMK